MTSHSPNTGFSMGREEWGHTAVDYRMSTLARGSRYVTANGVRNGLILLLQSLMSYR